MNSTPNNIHCDGNNIPDHSEHKRILKQLKRAAKRTNKSKRKAHFWVTSGLVAKEQIK